MARNIKGPWVCPCGQNEQLLIRYGSDLNFSRSEILPQVSLNKQQEELERKRLHQERKREKKKEKAAEEEPEIDPDVAAMMSFGGFRSSKK